MYIFDVCSKVDLRISSLLFTRKVLAGQFTMVQRLLMEQLDAIGLWTEDTRNLIIANGGEPSIRQ